MISVSVAGIDPTMNYLLGLDGQFKRARKSALASVGFSLMGKTRKTMENGGKGWKAPHAMTPKWWHREKGQWKQRSRYDGPGSKLGKFARYRVDRNATMVEIDFGKTKKGEPGKKDPTLSTLAWRFQEGRKVKVTPRMRRFFGAQHRKRAKTPGKTYFPLKKSTKYLTMPARPAIVPLFEQEEAAAIDLFREKFYSNLRRYGAI